MFFFGQLASSSLYVRCGGDQANNPEDFLTFTHFVISLDSTILLSSLTINGPIHTKEENRHEEGCQTKDRCKGTDSLS